MGLATCPGFINSLQYKAYAVCLNSWSRYFKGKLVMKIFLQHIYLQVEWCGQVQYSDIKSIDYPLLISTTEITRSRVYDNTRSPRLV